DDSGYHHVNIGSPLGCTEDQIGDPVSHRGRAAQAFAGVRTWGDSRHVSNRSGAADHRCRHYSLTSRLWWPICPRAAWQTSQSQFPSAQAKRPMWPLCLTPPTVEPGPYENSAAGRGGTILQSKTGRRAMSQTRRKDLVG